VEDIVVADDIVMNIFDPAQSRDWCVRDFCDEVREARDSISYDKTVAMMTGGGPAVRTMQVQDEGGFTVEGHIMRHPTEPGKYVRAGIRNVRQADWMGFRVDQGQSMCKHVARRIELARGARAKLRQVASLPRLPRSFRRKLYLQCVRSVLLVSTHIVALTPTLERDLESFQSGTIRGWEKPGKGWAAVANVDGTLPNTKLRRRWGVATVASVLVMRRLRWAYRAYRGRFIKPLTWAMLTGACAFEGAHPKPTRWILALRDALYRLHDVARDRAAGRGEKKLHRRAAAEWLVPRLPQAARGSDEYWHEWTRCLQSASRDRWSDVCALVLSFAPYGTMGGQNVAPPDPAPLAQADEASEEHICPSCTVHFASEESRHAHDLSRHNWHRKTEAQRKETPLDAAFQAAWASPVGGQFCCPFCQALFAGRSTVGKHFHTLRTRCAVAYRTWRQKVEDGERDAPFPVVVQTGRQRAIRTAMDKRMEDREKSFVGGDEWKTRCAKFGV